MVIQWRRLWVSENGMFAFTDRHKCNEFNTNILCILDYRPKVLARFGDRAAELKLDGTRGSPTELDLALVLSALRQSERLRQPNSAVTR